MSLSIAQSVLLHRPAFRAASPLSPNHSASQALRFAGSATLTPERLNVVFVSPEPIEAKSGGLGSVTESIPEAAARYSGSQYGLPDVDMRLLEPYLKPVAEQNQTKKLRDYQLPDELASKLNVDTLQISDNFEPTKVSATLDTIAGKDTFRLLQKFKPVLDSEGKLIPEDKPDDHDMPVKGNWIYAIDDDQGIFRGLSNLYYNYGNVNLKGFDKKYDPEIIKKFKDPNKAMARANFLFERAAGALLPKLDGSKNTKVGASSKALHCFEGKANVVHTNDWLTSLVTLQAPQSYKKGVAQVTQLHNTFDAMISKEEAAANGLNIPDKYFSHNGEASSLEVGIRESHQVVANNNYAHSITQTNLVQGAPVVSALKEKWNQGRITDMHHGLADDFSPTMSPALSYRPDLKNNKGENIGDKPNAKHRFQKLVLAPGQTKPTLEQVKTFKRQNKLALQEYLGLKQDPNMVVFGWVSRFDPNQKGFYLLMNAVIPFLKQNPKAQLVIAGPDAGHPQVQDWIKAVHGMMKKDPDLKRRLFLPNEFVSTDVAARINAGADFNALPSLYEPYGVTQLEAKKFFTKPIANRVDGELNSVYDPTVNAKQLLPKGLVGPKNAEKYGQTGIMMKPFDSRSYQLAAEQQGNAYARITTKNKKERGNLWARMKMSWSLFWMRFKKDVRAAKKTGLYDWVRASHLLSKNEQKILAASQKSFNDALNRAMKMAQTPNTLHQVGLNAYNYVSTEHHWDKFVPEYVGAYQSGMRNAKLTEKPSQVSS